MSHRTPSAVACPYTKLPDALLSELTPREHQLVHALLSYRWTDDAAIYPSIRTLATRLRCTDRTIQRTLRQLEERGYLIIQARYRDDQGQTSNLYVPGPLLVALLSPSSGQVATGGRDDHHPPVTREAGKRDPGNFYKEKRPGSSLRGCGTCGTRPGQPHLRGECYSIGLERVGEMTLRG